MFAVLLKHFIATQALEVLFDNVLYNFSTQRKFNAKVGDIVACTFIINGCFHYVSCAKVTNIRMDSICIEVSKLNVNMITYEGTFYMELIDIQFKHIRNLEVVC